LQLGQTFLPSHVGHVSLVSPIAPEEEPAPLHRGHLPLPLHVEQVPAMVFPLSSMLVVHEVATRGTRWLHGPQARLGPRVLDGAGVGATWARRCGALAVRPWARATSAFGLGGGAVPRLSRVGPASG
jgi:hypothetical protein